MVLAHPEIDPDHYDTRCFLGILGKTWVCMVNTPFLVEGRHDTLKKMSIECSFISCVCVYLVQMTFVGVTRVLGHVEKKLDSSLIFGWRQNGKRETATKIGINSG